MTRARRAKKPRVLTRCVANYYTGPNERIVEFSGRDSEQGGLISFWYDSKGRMEVQLYRLGSKVSVIVERKPVPGLRSYK